MNDTTQLVSDRLDSLERRCSRLRLWCAFLSAGALTACLSSALRPTPGVIEARSFVVIGPDGAVRARLESDGRGWTGLRMNGANEGPLAVLGVFEKQEGRDEGAALHLESATKDLEVFTAMAGKDRAGYFVTDDHLSIESWVKPGRSGIHFTTKVDGEDRLASAQRYDNQEESGDAPLLRLEVVGDKPTIDGLTPTGKVVFRQP